MNRPADSEAWKMSADYKNWIPRKAVYGLGAGTAALAAAAAGLAFSRKKPLAIAAGAGAALTGVAAGWAAVAYDAFSDNGKRKLAKRITDGVADKVILPEGGLGLDIGCGSGALTIECAKRNPGAEMIGVDRWGLEWHRYSKKLCEANADAEGVRNVTFCKADAAKLNFPDETFDAVTSNYVFHFIKWHNHQDLLREAFRVLKKGGSFAIHDVFAWEYYGNMERFVQEMKELGFEEVRFYSTANVLMTPGEASVLFLKDSAMLCGKK